MRERGENNPVDYKKRKKKKGREEKAENTTKIKLREKER